MGGVILNIDYRLTEQAFYNLGCKDFSTISSQAKQTELFNDFEIGKIKEEVFLEELKILSGLNSVTKQEIKTAWNAMLIDLPNENYELLKKLQGRYRIFLLSNTNETHIKGFTNIIERSHGFSNFENLFEKTYYSSLIGLRKPDADCFLHVLKENNLKREETIFIDDSIQHVEGAIKAGIAAHLLKNEIKTENLLRELRLL